MDNRIGISSIYTSYNVIVASENDLLLRDECKNDVL